MKKRWLLILGALLSLTLWGCGDTMDLGREISLGTVSEGVYTNVYAGLRCEFDSSWTLRDARQLQELPEDMDQLLKDPELGKDLTRFPYLWDLEADGASEGVRVYYTKLDPGSLPIFRSMNDDAVVEQVLDMQEELLAGCREAGLEDVTLEKVPVSFLGAQRVGLSIRGRLDGEEIRALQLYNYRLGGYGVTLTVYSEGEDRREALLGMFSSLD